MSPNILLDWPHVLSIFNSKHTFIIHIFLFLFLDKIIAIVLLPFPNLYLLSIQHAVCVLGFRFRLFSYF